MTWGKGGTLVKSMLKVFFLLLIIIILFSVIIIISSYGKGAKKGGEKLTSVSFMYVCVAGNGEMLVFFSFFPPTIIQ